MEIYDGFTEKHITFKTIQEFTGKDFQDRQHNCNTLIQFAMSHETGVIYPLSSCPL